MIPLSLSLKNFMCYREDVPTLHLEGIHVACLCGPNGHGKSALLDAITWALWGQARARTQEELIHQGQRDMQVVLEFQARGARYRVNRRHSRGSGRRQGATSLELQVASGDGFRPISGNTVRETEARIRDILSLDYQTFRHSAFLLQGRADLFTTATPSQRKEVLAEILNLSLYDRLEERARERGREREADILRARGELEHMRAEVARRPEYQQGLAEAEEELASLQTRLDASEGQVKALWGTLQHLNLRQARLREVLASFNHLYQRRTDLQAAIQLEGERLNLEAQTLERSLAEAEARVSQGEKAQQEMDGLRARLQDLEAQEERLRQQRQDFHDLAAHLQQTRLDRDRTEQEGKSLRAKLDLLHAETHADARCPLCNTQLGDEGRRNLAASYQEQIEEKRHLYQQHQDALQGLERKHRATKQEVDKAESSLPRQRTEAQKRQALLEHQVQDGVTAQEVLARGRGRLQAIQKMLEEKDFAQEARGQLSQLEGELGRVQREKEALEGEVEPLARVQAQYAQAQEERDTLVRQREPLASRRDFFRAQLERCDQMEVESRGKEKALHRLEEQRGIYSELATAFGKGGIQALIIESVVPELEAEANTLLVRLTEGRMNLKLETQRERRTTTGEPIETLDIKIADELGTRSYEMFSGGEAFRINFALRIALSRLLARRSGAPLPTLFIDEGFGTQDAAGRERLLEAIRSIQEDFERILVVTHIEELKDAFPVRIEVSRTEKGSTFWIS